MDNFYGAPLGPEAERGAMIDSEYVLKGLRKPLSQRRLETLCGLVSVLIAEVTDRMDARLGVKPMDRYGAIAIALECLEGVRDRGFRHWPEKDRAEAHAILKDVRARARDFIRSAWEEADDAADL